MAVHPFAFAAAWAALTWALPAAAQTVQWEVVDRFRLVEDPAQARALYDQVRIAPENASKGRSASFPSPLNRLPGDFRVQAIPVTAWDVATQTYRRGYAHPASWKVKASVPAWRTQNCEWTVQSSAAVVTGPCAGTVLDVQRADQVSAVPAGGAGGKPPVAAIDIQHKRVLVLGDSFASGEGVPELNQEVIPAEGQGYPTFGEFAYWWDQKCHRSMLSAGVQASLKWAMADAHRSVTTLSYACSGAAIGQLAGGAVEDGGILQAYAGRETREQLRARRHDRDRTGRYNVNLHEPDAQPLPSQLNQAIRDLCPVAVNATEPVWQCPQALAAPDLLVFSIGGNDVGFGKIITKAVTGNCEADCIRTISQAGFAALDSNYDQMASLVNTHLAPARVLMLDYGNPTQDEKGVYCSNDGSPFHAAKGMGVAVFTISPAEYRAAHRLVVVPLNEAGDKLVARNQDKGWARLRIMEKATATKGICSRRSWFNSSWAAYFKQYNLPQEAYSTGTAHPNVIYQSYQADAIVDWMKRTGF